MTDAFSKFAPPIRKWIRNQAWNSLRDIQEQAVHAILDRQTDILISATTASGKTEAAFLPLLTQMWNDPSDQSGFDLLYVSPLKSLINDQFQRLDEICYGMNIPVTSWHGDASATAKLKAIKNPKGLLLITPESLEAMFIKHGRDMSRLFKTVRAVVIDEFHSTFNSERGVHIRSLLSRLELAVKKSVRRIGLSATIGDTDLAREFLRPSDAESVEVIDSKTSYTELLLQLRGYVYSDGVEEAPPATEEIAKHIFKHLRGTSNLVFTGTRQMAEILADHLRDLCEKFNLPQEFYPHHANLAAEHREFIEKRLKKSHLPTTAICTSTLELGIDISEVNCVAQIGSPFSVASIRQRLGRSGRRENQPAILRQYSVESAITSNSNFADRLRLRLVRTIATIELLLEGWFESPQPQAMHLSTLVHQILSVIAERGGAFAPTLYRILCEKGVFGQVSTEIFLQVLRAMGDKKNGLIDQADNDLLLVGPKGEKLMEHYNFYAVFNTPEEYQVIEGGRNLGTYPVSSMIIPGLTIIFSGKRWLVKEVRDREKEILVSAADYGIPPTFTGDPGIVHDKVIERMFEIFKEDRIPAYLDKTAAKLLTEARTNFSELQFGTGWIVHAAENRWVLATRKGTVKTNTLALALRAYAFTVQSYDGFLEVTETDSSIPLVSALKKIALEKNINLLSGKPALNFEKYHKYLTKELLIQDAMSCRLDKSALPTLCRQILGGSSNAEFLKDNAENLKTSLPELEIIADNVVKFPSERAKKRMVAYQSR